MLTSSGQGGEHIFSIEWPTVNLELDIRALVLENFNSTLFYYFKKSLYHYTIPFYNTSIIPKLYFY